MTDDFDPQTIADILEDPDHDPFPGVTETPAQAVARLERENRRLKRKAAAANIERERMRRALNRSFRSWQEDVAHAFSTMLAAELEGEAVPVRAMPDIGGLVVDPLRNAMYFDPGSDAVQEWISERHPGRRL